MKISLLIKGSLFLLLLTSLNAQARHRKVKIVTTYGTIVVKLFDDTPKHRDNFLHLSRHHFYDSILFHRIIKNFMIQAGDPTSKQAKPGTVLGDGDAPYTIPAEIDSLHFHRRGALGAAREDNPAKASSGYHFYIVQGKKYTDEELDKVEQTRLKGRKIPPAQREVYKTVGGTPWLDMNYTIFGEVVSGMEVVDKIATSKTDPHDRPIEDIRIIRMRVQKKILFF